jgi:phosphonate transport system substrate-binding protein
MRLFRIFMVLALVASVFAGCEDRKNKPVVFVWYPNESGDDMKAAREEFGTLVTQATGRPVEHKLTTDYAITIETIVNGNADIAWLGGEGYVQAHSKNPKVLPLVVNTGKSGTLDDAVYYSWLCVVKGNEGEYSDGSGFKIDRIQGKRFSFVSNSSTSGFRVPSSGIINYFTKKPEWSALNKDALLEGGPDRFFTEVLFGGSHQGSAVNLLSGRADVAAFCDSCVANYVELVSETPNRPGSVYRVRSDAAEPFNTMAGMEFVLISVTPVLNAPFVYNSEKLNSEELEAIIAIFTSDETAANPKVFVPKDSEFKGLVKKESDKQKFLVVEDAWFNPIRELAQ